MSPQIETLRLPFLPVCLFKGSPNRWVSLFRKGHLKEERKGLSGWLVTTSDSLTAVPVGSLACPFAIKCVSADNQTVTLTGSAIFSVEKPERLRDAFDFSVNLRGAYLSDDPTRLPDRLGELLASVVFSATGRKNLAELLPEKDALGAEIEGGLKASTALGNMGFEAGSVAITSIRPSPDIEKALESLQSEKLKQLADASVHERQIAAELKDRQIKEEQLQTTKAVQERERAIMEAKMETAKRNAALEAEVQQIHLEKDRALAAHKEEILLKEARAQSEVAAIEAGAANEKAKMTVTLGEARAKALQASASAIDTLDAKKLQALALAGNSGQGAIGAAFLQLAENASRIGTLNISPDLLESLVSRGTE